MSAAMALRPIHLLIPLYSLTVGLCAAALGIMIGFGLGELGFSLGLLHVNGEIDDDMALAVMGFAMAGGLAGFVAGAVLGWRVIAGKGRG